MLPLIIPPSPNHTITLIVSTEARRFKSYMSQLETPGGAKKLSYKAFVPTPTNIYFGTL